MPSTSGAARKSHKDLTRSESLRAKVEAHIREGGLRWTDQRRMIVDVFLGSNDHLTLDELHALAKKRDRGVGQATIYRTLRLLVECGVAQERHFNRVTCFEIAGEREHHDHLICKRCGAILEFRGTDVDAMKRKVAARFGFELVSHELDIYGICAACRRRR